MKATKKSRPGVSSTRTAAETVAIGVATVPKTDSTTAATDRQIHISEFLQIGQQNAIPLRHLVQLTGMKSRALRRRIEAERRSGIPILSNCENGYFLPDSQVEVEQFVHSMRSRAREIEAVAAAVEKAGIG